jgi:hypothetical protein
MNDLLTRFIVAVETIGTALTAMASGGTGQLNVPATPGADSAAPAGAGAKPSGRGKASAAKDTPPAADTKAPDASAQAVAEAQAAQVAADQQAAADKAKAAEEGFPYEELKKAIIALASAGNEGKEQALRILTDAGVEKGGKASDAPKGKWKGMHADAVASLAKIKEADSFA